MPHSFLTDGQGGIIFIDGGVSLTVPAFCSYVMSLFMLIELLPRRTALFVEFLLLGSFLFSPVCRTSAL
jgi:hypothetical protein